MNSRTDYSINYSPAAGGLDGNNMVIPGGGASSHPTRSNKGRGEAVDEGVVITPDPSGIVIKTRLMKEKQNHFSFDDNNLKDTYVPPSLSSIYAGSEINSGDVASAESNRDGKGKDDTKVFLNICTHPLIAVPAQRKGIDEQTGKEIEGWRLPMSMGDLRPCYDKTGNAAIVADCILNPKVIREMNSDSNHFQFVCDLVVQCASRKFGRNWFGGAELDRRFKLPKMKYAGYVNEETGLPLMPPNLDGRNTDVQKAVVAKQRVKGHGGKASMIQEVQAESNPPKTTAGSGKALLRANPKPKTELRIELFIGEGDENRSMPLFDFLLLAAKQDRFVPQGQPHSTLRDCIKVLKLKNCGSNDGHLHESQLLNAPIPFGVTKLLIKSSDLPWSNNDIDESEDTGARLDSWSILAKCCIGTDTHLTNKPSVDLSAFLLELSTDNSKTQCILPFAVGTHQSSTTFNPETGVVKIVMPLLQRALSLEEGPDPGTRTWELQNALGSGSSRTATVDQERVDKRGCNATSDEPSQDMAGLYFLNAEVDDEDNDDDMQPLPEDAFHSQDALSHHLLQQQEDERKERAAKNDCHGRSEYINVDDFRTKPSSHGENESKEDVNSITLKRAQTVMEKSLENIGSIMGNDLILDLV